MNIDELRKIAKERLTSLKHKYNIEWQYIKWKMDCIFKDDIIKYLLEADILIEEIENERNNYKFIIVIIMILGVFILYIYLKKEKKK